MKPEIDHRKFMAEALAEAHKAEAIGEVPIGALIVIDGQVVTRAHNQVELLKDATAHAEILAITSASAHLGSKYLANCTLYVTLEPCTMCAGAIFWSKVGSLVYGASDLKNGFNIISPSMFHKQLNILGPIMQDECIEPVQLFFERKRKT